MLKPKCTLKNIEPYSTDEFYPNPDEIVLKLDSNENVFGPSENVVSAFKNLDIRRFNLYPCYGELLDVLAARFNLQKDNLLLTNGADEAINIILSTYLTSEGSFLSFSPSFSMPLLYSKVIGADASKVEYAKKWEFSIDNLLSSLNDKIKVIYLASPNNPTGDIIEPSCVEDVLKNCADRLVLLDLTYISYSRIREKDYYDLVLKYKNLVCVKSFSKDFALAGLRLGFIAANSIHIKEFKKVISPYSVNSLAVFAGVKSLEDVSYFEYVKKEVQKSKEFLYKELENLGFTPYKSEANFILVDFSAYCDFAYRKLLNCGIKVRKFSSDELKTCLRISIPPIKDAQKIIDALKKRKLLVFDLDGVVFDVSNSYRYAIKKTFEHFAGAPCTDFEMQEAKNLGGLSNDWDLTKYLLDKKGVKAEFSDIVPVFQSIFYDPSKTGSKGAIDNEKLVLGPEFFEALSKKYDLAVFTGRPREEAFYSLKKFGIDKFFSCFVCLEDVPHGRSKPYPDGLYKIKNNCYFEDICYFGDTPDDIKAGCSASVRVFGVIPPGAPAACDTEKTLLSNGACSVIQSASDILKVNLFEDVKIC